MLIYFGVIAAGYEGSVVVLTVAAAIAAPALPLWLIARGLHDAADELYKPWFLALWGYMVPALGIFGMAGYMRLTTGDAGGGFELLLLPPAAWSAGATAAAVGYVVGRLVFRR